MPSQIFRRDAFETLVLSNWTSLFDVSALLRRVLIDARDADLKPVRQGNVPLPQTKATITKFSLTGKGSVEVWADFTVPRADGVAVGTHAYELLPSGDLMLVQSYGVVFVAERD